MTQLAVKRPKTCYEVRISTLFSNNTIALLGFFTSIRMKKGLVSLLWTRMIFKTLDIAEKYSFYSSPWYWKLATGDPFEPIWLRFYNVSFKSYSAVTMLELSLNLPKHWKTTNCRVLTSGKCIFGYKNGKNEKNR